MPDKQIPSESSIQLPSPEKQAKALLFTAASFMVFEVLIEATRKSLLLQEFATKYPMLCRTAGAIVPPAIAISVGAVAGIVTEKEEVLYSCAAWAAFMSFVGASKACGLLLAAVIDQFLGQNKIPKADHEVEKPGFSAGSVSFDNLPSTISSPSSLSSESTGYDKQRSTGGTFARQDNLTPDEKDSRPRTF